MCYGPHSFFVEYLLFSDTLNGPRPEDKGVYFDEILDVYSNNPIHEVNWQLVRPGVLSIEIREPLQRMCADQDGRYFSLEVLSPGTLFIVTECGTATVPLGPVG